jgi:predicted lipid-binding transport protein (Tim44 family)
MTTRILYMAASASAVLLTLWFGFPEEAVARAGGGSSKGAGILILWPFFAIYSAIVTYYAVKKYREAKTLLARISESDSAWTIGELKVRIEQAYFAIQFAWRDRDASSAREYMSERLFQSHDSQLQDMKRNGTKNVMKSISLNAVKIVEVLDYNNDEKDRFVALIEGAMIDYLVNDAGEAIDGDEEERNFKELWRFKREPHGWVLDEIDSDVSISDVTAMQAWSETHP